MSVPMIRGGGALAKMMGCLGFVKSLKASLLLIPFGFHVIEGALNEP